MLLYRYRKFFLRCNYSIKLFKNFRCSLWLVVKKGVNKKSSLLRGCP
jgi:hypothetical protein